MPDEDPNIKLLKELIQNPKIGEILLHYKKITIEQLCEGLEQQKQVNLPIGQILIQMNIITENELIELLSIQSNIDKIVTESYNELEKLKNEKSDI
ncbi:MAG: hypothetical protein WCG23_00060 [bacterium]